jgi:LPXTG-motif cell wall-anchored protein
MRRFRLVAAAAAVAASLIAPSAILAEEPAADSTDMTGGVAAPSGSLASATADDSAGRAATPSSEVGSKAVSKSAAGIAVGKAAVASSGTGETLLAASRRSSAASASATPAASVTIQDYFFRPKTVTINTGETVKWTMAKKSVDHTATGDSFDSGVLKAGQSYTHKFSKAGSFDYICTIHPSMTGTVVVKAASSSGGNGNGGSSDGGTSNPSDSSGSVTGTDTSSAGSLPYTGQDLRVALVVGVNLMLAGVLLLLRSRHRAPR